MARRLEQAFTEAEIDDSCDMLYLMSNQKNSKLNFHWKLLDFFKIKVL